jgi:hypothetical protein
MKKIFTLLSVLITFYAYSQKTYVYFQNNTSLSFNVSCTQTGDHIMETSEWWGASNTLAPWHRNSNLLWTNRDAGVHSGNTFYHTVNLTSAGETVQLKLKMTGSFIGSSIWCSAAGPGFNHAWFSDRNFHSQNFTLNGKSMTIKYAFYMTAGYDDILYTIHENDPFPIAAADLTNPRKVNILSQNAYMRPSELFFDDQSTRKDYYDDVLHNYDAIIFQELFDDDVRAGLLAQLVAEYPYQSTVVDIPNHSALDPVQDGGILIVSRWPIETQDQFLFGNNCNADDCLAYKGFKYCRINKLGVKYHLFDTHMDAFNEEVDVNIRKSQLQQAKTYIAGKAIPATEAVLFGGDLNIDRITNKFGEYDSLWAPFFDAQLPVYDVPMNPSWNSNTNKYLSGTSDAPEYLDYVLAMKSNLLPDIAVNQVTPYRSIADAMWKKFDISDHYGVKGTFTYTGSIPTCALSNGLAVSAITQTSAIATWTAVSGVVGYNVRYKTLAGSTWTTQSVTSNTITLNGLTAGTAYEVQVQNNCGGLLYGAWSASVNFTTLSNSCTDTYEANETRTTAKSIVVNTDITAKIGTATDVDWFVFTTSSTQKNIKVNLTNLPANYDLQLYDSKGALLRTSANTGTTAEQVVYNTTKSGTFYARVYGVSGASNTACYTLRTTISASSLRSAEPQEEVTETSREENVRLYPNPVNQQLSLEFNMISENQVYVTIYDISGKLISVDLFDGAEGSNVFYKDVQTYANGFYIISLSTNNEVFYNGKFVKN